MTYRVWYKLKMLEQVQPNLILMVSHKRGLPRISPTVVVRSRRDIAPKGDEGELVGISTGETAVAFFHWLRPFNDNYRFEYRLQISPFMRPCYLSVKVVNENDDTEIIHLPSEQLKLPAPDSDFLDWTDLLDKNEAQVVDYVRWKDKEGKRKKASLLDESDLANRWSIERLIEALDDGDESVHNCAINFLKLRDGRDKAEISNWLLRQPPPPAVVAEKVLIEFAHKWSQTHDTAFGDNLQVLILRDHWTDSVWDQLLILDSSYRDGITYVSDLQKRLLDDQQTIGFRRAATRFISRAALNGDPSAIRLMVQLAGRDYESGFGQIPTDVQEAALDQLIVLTRGSLSSDLLMHFQRWATNERFDVVIRQKAAATLNREFLNAYEKKSLDQEASEFLKTSKSLVFDMNLRLIKSKHTILQILALKMLIAWAGTVRVTFSPDDYTPADQRMEIAQFRQTILAELKNFQGDTQTLPLRIELSILLHAPQLTRAGLNEELFALTDIVMGLLDRLQRAVIIYPETLSWLCRALRYEALSEKALQVLGMVNIHDRDPKVIYSLETYLIELLIDKKRFLLVMHVIRQHRLWRCWDESHLIENAYRDTREPQVRDLILKSWEMVLHPGFILAAVTIAKNDINHLRSLQSVLQSVQKKHNDFDTLLAAINQAILLAQANNNRSNLAHDVVKLMQRCRVPLVTSNYPEDNLNSLRNALEMQRRDLQRQFDDSRDTVTDISQRCDVAYNQVTDNKVQVSNLTAELSGAEREIKRQENRRKNLQSQIDKLEQHPNQDISEDERRRILQQIEQRRKELNEVAEDISTRISKRQKLEQLLQASQTASANWQRRYTDLKQELALSQRDMQRLQHSSDEFEDLWNTAMSYSDTLRRLNDEIESADKLFAHLCGSFERDELSSIHQQNRIQVIDARRKEFEKHVAANSRWDSIVSSDRNIPSSGKPEQDIRISVNHES